MNVQDRYVEKVEEQLQEWKTDIDKLKAKAEKAEAQVRTEYHKKLDTIQEKRAAAETNLKQLKEASEESWEDLIKGYEEIRNDLTESIASVQSSFK